MLILLYYLLFTFFTNILLMNYKVITTDIIFLVILAIVSNKFIISKYGTTIVILNSLIWGFIILSTLSLYFNKYIYSLGLFILGPLVVMIYLIKIFDTLQITPQFTIIFWMLFLVTSCSIIGLIITKKYILNNMFNEAPQGKIGSEGSIGQTGESYKIDLLADKCYNDLLTHIEDKLKKIKDTNDIDYDNETYLLKNTYIKTKLKDICYSTDFLNDFFKDKYQGYITYDNLHNDASPIATYPVATYNTKIIDIKHKLTNWIFEILESDQKQLNKLNEKYKINKSIDNRYKPNNNNTCIKNTNISTCKSDINCNYDETLGKCHLNYENANSIQGNKLLNDYFANENYYEKYMKKNNKENPFCKIKSGVLDNKSPNKALWDYGKNINTCDNN